MGNQRFLVIFAAVKQEKSMKQAISTPQAPAAIGPYSQAIRVGNLLFTSGQIPIDPATGIFVEGGIKEQDRKSVV